MKKIIHTFIFSFLICLLLIPVSAVYANNTEINIGNITAVGGKTVDVPITLSGNTGICGANIVISYDKALSLTGITKGSALSTLTMTNPEASPPTHLQLFGTEWKRIAQTEKLRF